MQYAGYIPSPPPRSLGVTSYGSFQSWNFTVAAGTHTVTLISVSQSTGAAILIDNVAINPVQDTILDGGFEQPALPANSFQYDQTGSAWQFSATAGISRNGSNFQTNWTETQNAPAGTQVAFIQEYGSMSQSVYLDAGTYQLSFLAAQRAITSRTIRRSRSWSIASQPESSLL